MANGCNPPQGTGDALPLTTKGDLLCYSTELVRVPIGTNGQVPIADSTQDVGWKWGPAGGISASDVVKSGILADRPAAGTAGVLYYATDINIWFHDNGATWDIVGGGAHAQLFRQLATNSKLPANVFKGLVSGALLDTFDAEAPGASASITEVVGGADLVFGGSTVDSYAWYNIGSSKSQVLALFGVCGFANKAYIAFDTAARAATQGHVNGYSGGPKMNAGDAEINKLTASAITVLDTAYDSSNINAPNDSLFALYADGDNNVQELYLVSDGKAVLLGSASDSAHSSFAAVGFHARGINTTVRLCTPLVILTN